MLQSLSQRADPLMELSEIEYKLKENCSTNYVVVNKMRVIDHNCNSKITGKKSGDLSIYKYKMPFYKIIRWTYCTMKNL